MEMEDRLAQGAAELAGARSLSQQLEARLMGAKPREEVEQLIHRLEAAESGFAQVNRDQTEKVYKAEVGGAAGGDPPRQMTPPSTHSFFHTSTQHNP